MTVGDNAIWKPVIGYEPYYTISEKGVWSIRNNMFLKLSFLPDHGMKLGLTKDGVTKTFKLHRLLGEHFIPNPDKHECIIHINGDKSDNRIENLKWATRSGRVKHGMCGTKPHRAWLSMKKRCASKSKKLYPHYGARGISVSEEFQDFNVFLDYIKTLPDYDRYLSDPMYSIDRTDNDKGYERGNLRFVDKCVQAQNQRMRITNTSGYRGVSYNKKVKKYIATIRRNGKTVHVGCFNTPIDGHEAIQKYKTSNQK